MEKWKNYTALASVLLLGNAADSEVIYTDVDPDVVVDVPGTGVLLDLDGDGTDDFAFYFSTTNFINFTYYGGFNFYAINAIFAQPLNGNSIAAFTGSSGAYAYPYAIGSGIQIGPYAGQFLNNTLQSLAYQFYALINSFYYIPLVWAGDWIFGENSKFVGLKLNQGDSTYYGWVRLNVAADNRSFTVKDFAYENISDQPITTEFHPDAIENNKAVSCAVYTYENIVNISGLEINGSYTVHIFDLKGALVEDDMFTGDQAHIHTAVPVSGMYLVTVRENSSGAIYSGTYWIEDK
ncbi:MAG: hypothetical protein R2794_00905 [Chitinophagales bacterium]